MDPTSFDKDQIATGLVDDKTMSGTDRFWELSDSFGKPHDPSLDVSMSTEHEQNSTLPVWHHIGSAGETADYGGHRNGSALSVHAEGDQKTYATKPDWEPSQDASSIRPASGPESSHIMSSTVNNGLQAPAALLASPGDETLLNLGRSRDDKEDKVEDLENLAAEFPVATHNSQMIRDRSLSGINLLREDVDPSFRSMPPKVAAARDNRGTTMSQASSRRSSKALLQQENAERGDEDNEDDEEDKEDDEESHTSSDLRHDEELREELPKKWILTLSMHFRDGTKREKFFITYIREPNDWVRVTVSVDYNHGLVEVAETDEETGAPVTTTQMRGGSETLEGDLETMQYQRDKNFVIYKAVQQSLEEIKFFSTITNLQLETLNDRLHIRVAEDLNEQIPYPLLSVLDHLNFAKHQYVQVTEDQVTFDSHLSGFVYKVRVCDRTCVKKEITSIDTVQEFLYEVEALARLRKSKYVINLFGIVIGEHNGHKVVTGVLLEYASGGALNDFFYENAHKHLHTNKKMTWIRQVVQGISDIHESGYVQGDCTLSNVVIDSDENAKIVDINRRGCPLGWEPPEFRGMIHSGQRISMFIGVKSDLFQLGMVIWAIWHKVEEPDRCDQPLEMDDDDPDIPSELREVVKICLSDDPVDRLPAKELLTILKPLHEYSRPPMRIGEITEGVAREDIQASQRGSKLYHRRGSRDLSEDGAVGAFFTQDKLSGKLQQTQLVGMMGEDTNMMEAELGLGAFADDIKEPGLLHFDSGLPDEEYTASPLSRHLMDQANEYEPKRHFAHQDSGFPQEDVNMEDVDDAEPGDDEAEDEAKDEDDNDA